MKPFVNLFALISIKKRWIYIVFVLVFLPTPVYAQPISPFKSVSGKHSLNLGYVRDFGTHGLWLGGDRGLSDRTKISTNATVFFVPSDQTIGVYESSQIVHIAPLGSTGLDCFFFADVAFFIDPKRYDRYADLGLSERVLQYLSITNLWLGGGGGLSKTLGQFTAFAGLFYLRNVYTREEHVDPWYGAVSIGAEIEVTPYMNLTGAVDVWYVPEFGFYSPPAFYIGLNLNWN